MKAGAKFVDMVNMMVREVGDSIVGSVITVDHDKLDSYEPDDAVEDESVTQSRVSGEPDALCIARA